MKPVLYPEPLALALSGQGWSLIPILGDTSPGREKIAAIVWKQHQQKRASDTDIAGWLSSGWQPAIVTGRGSGLVVIDFDDPTIADEFRRDHASTARHMLWVKTRRGIHGYLAVSPYGDSIPSMNAPGVNFQADGRYVVAMFARIGAHEYEPENRLTVLNALARRQQLLSPVTGGLKAIQAFMFSRAGTAESLPEPEAPAESDRLSIPAAQSIYLSWHERGRNNALYHTAALMHDHFYRVEDCLEALLTLFINSGAYEPGREREGRATIYSAFKRKRRPVRKIIFRQMPNCIRETMHRLKQSAAVRVLDCLRESGIGPGAAITQKVVYQSASAAGIGGHSVRQFFGWLESLSEPHRQAKALQQATPEPTTQNEFCVGVKNRQKILKAKKGRPENLYVVPDNTLIANLYGIRLYKASDSLQKGDFKSIRTYRAGLHREFIKRRPGQHPIAWLVTRTGKTRQTLKHYNRIAGIKVQAAFNEVVIKHHNLSMIPDWNYLETYTNKDGKTYLPGIFLEIEGKNYPAMRQIAVAHLSNKNRVVLKFQTESFYWHKSQPERAPAVHLPETVTPSPEFNQTALWQRTDPPTPANTSNQPEKQLKDSPGNAPRQIRQGQKIISKYEKPAALPAHSARRYRSKLAQEHRESLAGEIHRNIPEISQPTARRMVHLCDLRAIHRAMAVVNQRQPDNPAGYFATIIGFPVAVRAQQEQAAQRKAYREKLREDKQ